MERCRTSSQLAARGPDHQYGRRPPGQAARRPSGGFIIVWVALLLFVLVGIAGISLDWGKSSWNVHELNNAADAGALAGAQLVKYDPAGARQLARTLAFENHAENRPVSVADNPENAIDGEVVLGRWIRQENRFVETDISPTAVKVVGRRLGQREDAPPLRLHFGPVFATDTVAVSRYAIAWARDSSGAGIIVLADNPDIYPSWSKKGTGFWSGGGTVIDLRGFDSNGNEVVGDIQVNTDSTASPWQAMLIGGGSVTIAAGEVNVNGGTSPDPNSSAWAGMCPPGTDPFSVNAGASDVKDPLAKLKPPALGTPVFSETIDANYVKTHGTASATGEYVLTLQPGYYPGGISVNGNGLKIVLTGGPAAVYIFGGGTKKSLKSGLVLGGGASFEAIGVMIYLTGNPPNPYWACIDIDATTSVNLKSRGDAGFLPTTNGEAGIAIWQDRSNPTYGTIIGGGDFSIAGTIYCGYNPLEIGGNATQMGNQLIVGCLNLHGDIVLGIAYDGRNLIKSHRSILVR